MKKVIALGAENKTTFSSYSDKGLHVSEENESLSTLENYNSFEKAVRNHIKENDIKVETVACDLHPDYRSTELAEILKEENAPNARIVKVQHHFAHIVSCMLDNDIDEEVIGVSFDGTGYGSDGKTWGGEFLLSTRKSFTRKYHLEYMPQPGGDIAAREAWRMALAYLIKTYGNSFKNYGKSLINRIGESRVDIIAQMVEKDINSPETSSMGRLFDAVASLIGICDESTFEAEAAILLEAEATNNIKPYYHYEIKGEEIIVTEMIEEIMDDLKRGAPKGEVSAKFHNTVGEIIIKVSKKISSETGINKVLISGGCFQNKYLVKYLEEKIKDQDLELFKHKNYSPTDLGISVGQAVVAANKQ